MVAHQILNTVLKCNAAELVVSWLSIAIPQHAYCTELQYEENAGRMLDDYSTVWPAGMPGMLECLLYAGKCQEWNARNARNAWNAKCAGLVFYGLLSSYACLACKKKKMNNGTILSIYLL